MINKAYRLWTFFSIITIYSILEKYRVNGQSISVDLTTTTINANSVYKFVISDTRLQSSNGFIVIGFPSTLYTLSSLSCFNTDTPTQIYSCSISSSNVIVTYNKASFPSPYISISISSPKNPPSKQSLNFTYAFSSTSTVIPAQAYMYINPLTPDTLQSCSISFSPSTVNTQSTATLTITTKNIVDTNGSITITLPSSWPNSVSTASQYRPLQYGSTTCTKISGTQLKSTLQCDILLTDQKISVYQAFGSNVPALTTISFSIAKIKTPPTTSPSYTLTIGTQTSNGYSVDQSQCTISAVSQQTLSITSSSTFMVGNNSMLQMSWQTQSPLKINDTLTLTLPISYISFFQYSTSVMYYQTTKSIQRNITALSSTSIRYNISKLQSSDTQITSSSTIQITNVVIQCLVDASPRSIALLVSRNGYNIATGMLTITPTANLLTSVVVGSDVGVVSAPMALNISFNTYNSLSSTAQLKVQIPSAISLTGTSPTCTISSPTTPSAVMSSITCTLSSYLVTVSSFLQATLPANSNLILIISSALRNPQTSQQTSPFIISTYSSSSNYLVDQSSTATYTATPGTIGNISIQPTSYTVGSTNTYTISYNILRTIKSGSSIIVKIPTQLSLSSSPSYTYAINNSTSTTITPSMAVVGSNTVLTFSGIITTQLVSGNNIVIKIISLRNPLSMQPSSSFQVSASYNGYTIQTLTTGLTVTMTTLAEFNQVFALVSMPTNGATQDYTFYIKPSISINTGDKITIQIINNTLGLNQLSFTTSITSCSIYYLTTTITNTCSVSGTLLTITTTGPITDTSGTTQYRLVISSVILARTPTLSSKFKLTSYTSTGSNTYGVQTKTIDSITNTQSNKIQQLQLTILTLPSQLNTKQQLQLRVKMFNGIDMLNDQYFVLQIPSSFTYLGTATTLPICSNSIYTCTYHNSNNNAIKVAKSAMYSTVGYVKQFTVVLNAQLYVSPTVFADYSTDYFYATSYTSGGLMIDKTVPSAVPASRTYFYRTCVGKCKTCLDSNTSYCLTCYHSGDGVLPGILYGGYNSMTQDNQCVDICGDGYYNNSGVCTLCVVPCRTCISETECNSCRTGYYYISTAAPAARCSSTCPQKTYADSATGTCISCSNSCYNCTSSATTCTSCASGLYLSAGTCVSTCSLAFTYQNAATNKCQSCDLSCNTTTDCGANATDCVSCTAGYYRANASSSQCVNSCPSGSVSNPSTSVCECSSSCLTCSGTLSHCTSCISTLFLYNSNCIGSCPAQTYQPASMQTCLNCIDIHCTQCTSVSCLKCSNSYYLSAGSCITVCPQGTRIQNYQCILCQVGCKVCLSASICTSCFTGYLIQSSSCVTSCSAGFINFNATQCLTQCPIGYYNNSNKCQLIQNDTNNNSNPNTNNNTNNTTISTVNYGKIVPFPYTIAYIILIGIAIGMKCLYPATLLPSAIMSIGSIVQVMSVITLIIVAGIQLGTINVGIGILIVCLLLTYVCNVVNIVLVVKVLNADGKYMSMYKKSVCANIVIRCISTAVYHKFHEIIFSNIFGIRVFCNKVDYVKRLYPFNVLLIISLFVSFLCVIGASIESYSVQEYLLGSSTFIQSVDCIVVVVLNVIPTVLVLRRKDTEYEKDVNDSQAKRYETQDQLNGNNQSVGIEEAFIEESGALYGSKVSKVGGANNTHNNNRKNYFYQNSKKSQSGQDPYQTPLDKKRISVGNHPIGSGIVENPDAEQSSQALCFGDKKKNKGIGSVEEISQGIQEIMLEEPTGDNAGNMGRINSKNSKDGNIGKDGKGDHMVNYTGYDLDPKLLLLQENSEQFKKLPSETKAKIRMAKANLTINKNSENLKETIPQDMEEIQLSPKKQSKLKIEDEQKGSMSSLLDNSGAGLLNQSTRKRQGSQIDQNGNKIRSKSISKSKSKSKEKDKNRSKSKSIGKAQKKNSLGQNVFENKKSDQVEGQDTQHENRMVRNRSQQMQKKQGKQQALKTTKSQNIKQKKKKPNQQIKVLFNNGVPGMTGSNQENVGQEQADYQEDEPTLPVFKHKALGKNGEDSDGLDAIQQNEYGDRAKRDKLSNRRSQNLDDYNLNNLRNIKGDRPMRNQQPDDLPQMHSSQQLGKLVVVNKNLKNRRSKDLQFSNDDSSIYRKIYNDDTETLKSVQGDNFFGEQVSPSRFNVQNQRFEQTEASNDMPLPPTFDFEQADEKANKDGFSDQLEGHTSEIKRYSSNHNIDYDSVLSKRVNNGKIKQLEKIYLPRLEVVKPNKKKK